MRAGFGLPPGVDDGAALLADDTVIPHPGFGVDRFADGAEQADGGQVVFVGVVVAEFHQRANRGWRGVEDGDLVLLTHFPETPGIGNHRRALKHDDGRTGG